MLPDGFGFLRTNGFTQGDRDVYVSLSQIRRFGLRRGDEVAGQVREPKDNEKYNALLKIDGVNGIDPDAARSAPCSSSSRRCSPRSACASRPTSTTRRRASWTCMCPIGKGQRGLIVSPPKAGKTTILKKLANSIAVNNPEIDLFVLLVDERPEEVTDMQRSVIGTVVASTFDQPSENHVQVTELVLDRVKRLVEMGHDVVVLLDSITRMARAFNLNTPASGRILSGGVDSTALYPPKKFFGAARNIEEGGSLTILATALVDTGSRMDEVIFEEFKGTGNMEIRLDRKLADKRIFPAIDIDATGTRKEELLMEPAEAAAVWKLRSRAAQPRSRRGHRAAHQEDARDQEQRRVPQRADQELALTPPASGRRVPQSSSRSGAKATSGRGSSQARPVNMLRSPMTATASSTAASRSATAAIASRQRAVSAVAVSRISANVVGARFVRQRGVVPGAPPCVEAGGGRRRGLRVDLGAHDAALVDRGGDHPEKPRRQGARIAHRRVDPLHRAEGRASLRGGERHAVHVAQHAAQQRRGRHRLRRRQAQEPLPAQPGGVV